MDYMRLSNYYKLNSLDLTLMACHYIYKIKDITFLTTLLNLELL